MSSWQETTLGELLGDEGSIKTGPFGTALKASEYSDTGVPVISVGEVGYGRFQLRKDTPRVTPITTDRLPEYVLTTNDIVFGRKGAVDRSSIVRKPENGWFLGSDGIRVRLPSSVDAKFIAYQLRLKSTMAWLLQHASGSTMLSLNQKTLERVPLTIPSVKTQANIVEVLDAFDDKIEANTKLSRTIDEFLSASFARITADSSTIRLGDVATVNPESCKPASGESLRYIDISSVGQGTYEFPELSSWDDAPSRARRQVRKGDTLWSTVRPNRRSHALNLSTDELLVGSTGLAVLRPHGVGYSYLYESTKTPEFSAYLENVAEGSAYPAVRATRFEDAPISWPPIVARKSFEMTADPLRKMQHSLELENRHLATARDALLPQLMSGKLRVKDAEELVESVV